MSFIKTRKKIVSSAIASSLSVVAVPAIAQDDVSHLPTIHAEASTDSLKVDNSANKKYVAPLLDTQNLLLSFLKNCYKTPVQIR